MGCRTGAEVVFAALVVLLLAACQPSWREPAREWSAVPIESFESIAGRWSGLLVRSPRARQDDWIRVTIGMEGDYEFAGHRTIGVLSGHGRLTLADGRVALHTEQGTATGALWESDGKRVLRVTGLDRDGKPFTAELMPAG